MNVSHLSDLALARERVLEQENHRPGPRDFSAFWEGGQWWQQAFAGLIAAEIARDTFFAQRIGAISIGVYDAHELLQRWASGLRESVVWYEQLARRLDSHQRAWGVDKQGQSLAPPEIVQHRAQVETRRASCEARRAAIAVEYMEWRRRRDGRLNEREWRRSWEYLQKTFKEQNATWRNHYRDGLREYVSPEQLALCQRVRDTQAATLDLWKNQRNVERGALQIDAAAVSGMIDTLRPPRLAAPHGWVWGLVAVVVVVIAVIVFSRAASTRGPGAQRETASPPRATASAAPGDALALNASGVELLKQGRCQEAIAKFEQAAAARTSWHEPPNNQAFCLYELGRVDEAIAKWRASITLDPARQDAHAGLGMALYQIGQREEGLREYQQAIDLGGSYLDEGWMRSQRSWSEKAIADSRPLREALAR